MVTVPRPLRFIDSPCREAPSPLKLGGTYLVVGGPPSSGLLLSEVAVALPDPKD